jgi:dimethylargininase
MATLLLWGKIFVFTQGFDMVSSYRTFTHALVRSPADNMGAGLTTQTLGSPDIKLAKQQYVHYLSSLRDCGLSLDEIEADSKFPDGHFVEDTAVLYRDLAIITQPGAASRRGESSAIAPRLPHTTRVHLSGDEFLDGGDVLFCANRVLIGLSNRTNQTGAERLRVALLEYDSSLKVEFVQFGGVLHLKSGLTELTPGILLRSPEFESDHIFDFAKTITLPHNEGYAVNVLPINDSILILAGYPTVAELASQHYARIFEIPMTEFQKMDGSLTCLSLLW